MADPPPPLGDADPPLNGRATSPPFLPSPASSKRRRRPSVRLGDLGSTPRAPSSKPRHPIPRRRRRVRTNWPFPVSADVVDEEVGYDGDANYPEFEDDLGREDSESPLQVRAWEEEEAGPSGREGGVKGWLSVLGLGRYAPVFELHGVDEEVLPMVTLEDLKDMGIGAVGARRKIFCAIQKLRKRIS